MGRRRKLGVPGADRLWTLALVLLSLLAGAFLSSLVYRWTGPPPPGTPGDALPRDTVREAMPDRSRIRIEVLNAAGIPGLAGRMTRLLRSRGFDVVNYGNALESSAGPTSILDRVGNSRFAREVALVLPGTPIRQELSGDRFIDVTVIVGEDYGRFFSADDEAPSP